MLRAILPAIAAHVLDGELLVAIVDLLKNRLNGIRHVFMDGQVLILGHLCGIGAVGIVPHGHGDGHHMAVGLIRRLIIPPGIGHLGAEYPNALLRIGFPVIGQRCIPLACNGVAVHQAVPGISVNFSRALAHSRYHTGEIHRGNAGIRGSPGNGLVAGILRGNSGLEIRPLADGQGIGIAGDPNFRRIHRLPPVKGLKAAVQSLEHHRTLGTGRAVLGIEAIGAVPLASAVENAGLPHGLHRIRRKVRNLVGVGKGIHHILAETYHLIIINRSIAHQEGGHLLAGHRGIGRKHAVAGAFGNAIAHGPGDIGRIIRIRRYILEQRICIRVVLRRHTGQPPQNRDEHAAGHRGIGLKAGFGYTLKYIALQGPSNGILCPMAADVGDAA